MEPTMYVCHTCQKPNAFFVHQNGHHYCIDCAVLIEEENHEQLFKSIDLSLFSKAGALHAQHAFMKGCVYDDQYINIMKCLIKDNSKFGKDDLPTSHNSMFSCLQTIEYLFDCASKKEQETEKRNKNQLIAVQNFARTLWEKYHKETIPNWKPAETLELVFNQIQIMIMHIGDSCDMKLKSLADDIFKKYVPDKLISTDGCDTSEKYIKTVLKHIICDFKKDSIKKQAKLYFDQYVCAHQYKEYETSQRIKDIYSHLYAMYYKDCPALDAASLPDLLSGIEKMIHGLGGGYNKFVTKKRAQKLSVEWQERMREIQISNYNDLRNLAISIYEKHYNKDKSGYVLSGSYQELIKQIQELVDGLVRIEPKKDRKKSTQTLSGKFVLETIPEMLDNPQQNEIYNAFKHCSELDGFSDVKKTFIILNHIHEKNTNFKSGK